MYLGIDAGGTHTDAVLISQGRVLCSAKVPTNHQDLPSSFRQVLASLRHEANSRSWTGPSSCGDLRHVRRVTLGATLAVNALVQGKADPVGLALSAGPGMDPARFALGEHVHIVPGGLDHRGVEVTALDTGSLREVAARWHQAGVRAFAVAGKFSPRNASHEKAMAAHLTSLGHVTEGHTLSGLLNFPRRVAGAYFNAAVWRLHNAFLHAVEEALLEERILAPVFLLKADGGAAPLAWSRLYPVESILSGPAASVMGVLALCSQEELAEDAVLLDMGGTTTDIALYAAGCPVLDRVGMRLPLQGRLHATHTRALATQSLGVGGDSLLRVQGQGVTAQFFVGPQREGPAMAFGGVKPTLLDALNVLDAHGQGWGYAGDRALSVQGVTALAQEVEVQPVALAKAALEAACTTVAQGLRDLLAHVNEHPVYTLAELLEGRQMTPRQVWLVGGPAQLMREALEKALVLPVRVPDNAATANAVGAALTLPTLQLELFADTTQGFWRVPVLGEEGRVHKQFSLREAREKAVQLLLRHAHGMAPEVNGQPVDVLEADIFATLDERGHGGKDIRVRCQLRPGIVAPVRDEV